MERVSRLTQGRTADGLQSRIWIQAVLIPTQQEVRLCLHYKRPECVAPEDPLNTALTPTTFPLLFVERQVSLIMGHSGPLLWRQTASVCQLLLGNTVMREELCVWSQEDWIQTPDFAFALIAI